MPENRAAGGELHTLPTAVSWDITYACPLLCTHCYSESGRRPSKQLEPAQLLAVTEVLVSMRLSAVFLSGGEPLIVKGIFGVIERLRSASIPVHVFTSGWNLDEAKVAQLAPLVAATHVSLDGATAEVHDSIRKRKGSFERAMRGLAALDEASRARVAAGRAPLLFGLDCSIMRSNFHQLQSFVTDVARRFPQMGFVNIGATIPTGLASEEAFAETELLTEDELAVMRDRKLGPRLSSDTLIVSVSDNRQLRMAPDDIKSGLAATDTAQVEADGNVRAMAIYEGTVGSLLQEPPKTIWARAQARWRDPFVVELLSNARTMTTWASATRAIDQRYGAPDDLLRIGKRRTSDGAAPRE